ncbi:MAG TPA: hypothetical protein VFO99_04940 [Pyrinomonadaceae bacterium]|nr:hypothetical protein [Pyrinomonadaceae bacterium]
MKQKRCELVRRELEELMLNEEFSAAAAEHLQTCSNCREFQRQQTKLRRIVGSLGTVNAPADFDFRLRARLAADAQTPSFRYWSMAVKGLATAAIVLVFGIGAAVIWQRDRQQTRVVVAPRIEPIEIENPPKEVLPIVAVDEPTVAVSRPLRKVERSTVSKPKRTVTAVDFSSERASVVTSTRPALDTAAVFPIEASMQSVKVSLDDGRGNARTISFPTVSFGSQRVPVTANQFAPKGGVW